MKAAQSQPSVTLKAFQDGVIKNPFSDKFLDPNNMKALSKLLAEDKSFDLEFTIQMFHGHWCATQEKFLETAAGCDRDFTKRAAFNHANKSFSSLVGSFEQALIDKINTTSIPFVPQSPSSHYLTSDHNPPASINQYAISIALSYSETIYLLARLEDGTAQDIRVSRALMMISSKVVALKKEWQNVLWRNLLFTIDGEKILARSDRAARQHEFVWGQLGSMFGAFGQLASPGYAPSVSKSFEIDSPRFPIGLSLTEDEIIGSIELGTDSDQAADVGEFIDAIARSYLSSTLELEFANSGLNIRVVLRAWLALEKLVGLIIKEHSEYCDRLRFSEKAILEFLSEAIGIDVITAKLVMEFLCFDVIDGSHAFDRTSACPLHRFGDTVTLLLPAFYSLDALFLIEIWLVRACFDIKQTENLRGPLFEEKVRNELASAIEDNSYLVNTISLSTKLEKTGILDLDCIVVVDGQLFIFECKCILPPSSAKSTERFFTKLNKACIQLEKNLAWANENKAEIAAALGLNPSAIVDAPALGAVVTNCIAGCGYCHVGIPVVPYHYILDIFSGTNIKTNAFLTPVGITSKMANFAFDDAQLREQLPTLLTKPPQNDDLLSRVEWRYVDWPLFGSITLRDDLFVINRDDPALEWVVTQLMMIDQLKPKPAAT